jgi:hypothetical protein
VLRGGSWYIDTRGLVAFTPALILIGILMIVVAITKGKPARTK